MQEFYSFYIFSSCQSFDDFRSFICILDFSGSKEASMSLGLTITVLILLLNFKIILQGMLFRWAPSESLPVFSYWVCGRLFLEPEPKEVYVAYHESTPQQMVELCFRLSFGL